MILGSERYLGKGNGNPLQYSLLGNPTDRGAWQAIVHSVAESDMTKHTHTSGTRNKLLFYIANDTLDLIFILELLIIT